jgi:hypothetical protein
MASKFRHKRSDTQIGTIEKKYHVDLDARSDMELGNYLKNKGYDSLSKLLEIKRKK